MNCQPIEALPPPPGFDLLPPADGVLSFNISDLPPPLPDAPPPPRPTEYAVHSQHPTQPPPISVPVNRPTTNGIKPVRQNSANTAGGNITASKVNSKGSAPPPTLAKKGKKLNTNFLAQLDAKLGGQPQQTNAAPPANDTSRPNPAVDSLMNKKSRESPPRDNLLTQIHGGVRLRRTENVNDRSAPKI